MFSYFKNKKDNKRRSQYIDEVKIFIQVHFVRERSNEKYTPLTLKTDPERDACIEWYNQHGNPDSFSDIVMIYLNEKNTTIENIASAYKLDSDILSNKNNPFTISKGYASAVCLGLHLNFSETKALLNKAGHALTNSSEADLIVRFCIENCIYDFGDIEYLLSMICDTNLKELV